MINELRKFPRINVDKKVSYEFVKWYEYRLDVIERPQYANIFDISVSGIGLSDLTDVNRKILRKLESGRKKIRLAIFLYKDNPPLMTFARLIWGGHMIDDIIINRYGFVFIDVSPRFYLEMMKFVNDQLNKQ
jgi:hypothetical protein